MEMEQYLFDEFMAEAKADHRPASQIMRALMREYIKRQKDKREYDEFLRRKVEVARQSMETGQGMSNDEVEAEFAARRAELAGRE